MSNMINVPRMGVNCSPLWASRNSIYVLKIHFVTMNETFCRISFPLEDPVEVLLSLQNVILMWLKMGSRFDLVILSL